MKVVFLQDVPNVAQAGQIKDVANGYGRNFLIPQKLAVQADPKMMHIIEAKIKTRARSDAQDESEMSVLGSLLDGQEITLKAKVGVKDHLYGSITPADIAAEIENVSGVAIDRKKVELDNPIRQLGTYEVPIRLTREVTPRITLTVVEEES